MAPGSSPGWPTRNGISLPIRRTLPRRRLRCVLTDSSPLRPLLVVDAPSHDASKPICRFWSCWGPSVPWAWAQTYGVLGLLRSPAYCAGTRAAPRTSAHSATHDFTTPRVLDGPPNDSEDLSRCERRATSAACGLPRQRSGGRAGTTTSTPSNAKSTAASLTKSQNFYQLEEFS